MKKKMPLKGAKIFSYFSKEILPRAILLFTIFLLLMPLLFEFQTASIAGKVFMAIGTAIYFLIVISCWVECEISQRKKPFEKRMAIYMRLMFVVMLVSEIYFSLRYFSPTIWGSYGIVTVSISLLFAFYGIYSIISNNFKSYFNKEKIPMIILSLAILFALIGGSIYSKDQNNALLFLRIAIGIAYLYVIALTISQTVLREEKKNLVKHRFLGLLILLAMIFGALISFPFYVHWCGVHGKYFDTFTSIYAAVVGGGLTLVGVAWTIRRSESDRKRDAIENARPFFGIINDLSKDVLVAQQNIIQFYKKEEFQELVAQKIINLVNSEKSDFYLEKLKLGTDFLYPDSNFMITKQCKFQLAMLFKPHENIDFQDIYLYICDENYQQRVYCLHYNAEKYIYDKITDVTEEYHD